MMDGSKSARANELTTMRWVLALTALFLCCLWGFIVFWGAYSRQEAIDAAENDLVRLSSAVEEQSRRTFKMVDVFLATADQWLRTHPERDARSDPEFAELVDVFRKATGESVDIRLALTNGDAFPIVGKQQSAPINIADREYFSIQLNPFRRGYYVGIPVFGRIINNWGLPISIPVHARKDKVAVLFAVIEVEKIAAQFDTERPRPGGAIALVRSDGILLTRAPYRQELIGRSVRNTDVFADYLPQASRGVHFSTSSGTDNVHKLVSYAALDDLPLVVIVAAATDDILAPWNKQCWVVGIAGGLLTILVLLAARHLLRLLQWQAESSAELRRLATTDGLTGALNRRTFLAELEKEVIRSTRYQSPLTVMMLDLDFFKRINDGYGHAVGDLALKSFADTAFASLRATDLFGRMGGEEFAILLPQTPATQVQPVAERLREGVAAIQLVTPQGVVRFTVSIGVADLSSVDDGFDSLLARADQALYAAKSAGRNRVCLAEAPSCDPAVEPVTFLIG